MTKIVQMTEHQFTRRFNPLLSDMLRKQGKPFLFARPILKSGPPPRLADWSAMMTWCEAEFGHGAATARTSRWDSSEPFGQTWIAIRNPNDALAFKLRWC